MFGQFLQKNSAELVRMQIGEFYCKETRHYFQTTKQMVRNL